MRWGKILLANEFLLVEVLLRIPEIFRSLPVPKNKSRRPSIAKPIRCDEALNREPTEWAACEVLGAFVEAPMGGYLGDLGLVVGGMGTAPVGFQRRHRLIFVRPPDRECLHGLPHLHHHVTRMVGCVETNIGSRLRGWLHRPVHVECRIFPKHVLMARLDQILTEVLYCPPRRLTYFAGLSWAECFCRSSLVDPWHYFSQILVSRSFCPLST